MTTMIKTLADTEVTAYIDWLENEGDQNGPISFRLNNLVNSADGESVLKPEPSVSNKSVSYQNGFFSFLDEEVHDRAFIYWHRCRLDPSLKPDEKFDLEVPGNGHQNCLGVSGEEIICEENPSFAEPIVEEVIKAEELIEANELLSVIEEEQNEQQSVSVDPPQTKEKQKESENHSLNLNTNKPKEITRISKRQLAIKLNKSKEENAKEEKTVKKKAPPIKKKVKSQLKSKQPIKKNSSSIKKKIVKANKKGSHSASKVLNTKNKKKQSIAKSKKTNSKAKTLSKAKSRSKK